MSGPFRFQPETSRSPLDRRPQNPFPAQPVSFKTNVNRMKTKKWVEAKKNAYDGDDWGDYDEYDEYGASEQEPPPQPEPQTRGYGQRSFTEPQRQWPSQAGRRNSFEAGEEQRAFSASMGYPPQPQGLPEQYAHDPRQATSSKPFVHPALRQAGGAESDTSDTPEHRRDFSPSAMPPPLQTRISSGPDGIYASGSPITQLPPRKSSIGQADAPVAVSPRDRASSNTGKPLPFIRPADIYKRHAEERERASLDEQRPNVEAAPGQMLPPVEAGASSFDDDFRSVVDQAFTRVDEQRSVPPTPISKSDSGVSRSNTDSTTGISPIMSRVPSSAASALKARNLAGGDGSTPMIAEEASESSTPVSRPTSAAHLGGTHQIPRKASPAHSRNISASSLPGSGLTTPNAAESPARSPAITPQTHLPDPETAELSSSHPPESTKVSASADAAVREADIAEAMRLSPVDAHPELSAAEMESQKAFLESHRTSTPIVEAVPRSRSESPSKGRVQALAGKFGDVSHSRRGSTQSNVSLQSWENSGENSRPTSPTKAASPSKDKLDGRPTTEREASFRPKLPGQWESYATIAASPNKELSNENLLATNNNVSSPLGEVDLTPTTAKRPVSLVDPSKPPADPLTNPLDDPLAALKAAGAAVGEAVQTSIGLGSSPTDESPREQTHGGILPRPLQLSRGESSVSTIPPTPPAKDTPESEEMPPPPPLKERSPEARSVPAPSALPERPIMLPQLSTDTAADDQESDRLRKEIVASLSPQQTPPATAPPPDPASLHAGTGPINRESSLLPREYESYWADGDDTSPLPSHGQGRDRTLQIGANAVKPITTDPLTQSPDDATKPSLRRFSWEAGNSGLLLNKLQETPTTNQTSGEEKIPAPAVEKGAEAEEARDFPDPYFGPTHGVAVIKPEPISDADLNARSSTTDLASPSISLPQPGTDRTASPVSGLHVVNSALHPEAVDLPARLSREVSPLSDQAHAGEDMTKKDSSVLDHDSTQGHATNPAVSAPLHGNQEPTTSSPTVTEFSASDKPLGFKDILQIKSPAERISHYNKTRNYWAQADHGLGDWVSTAVSANPDLVTKPYPQTLPKLNTSGTLRHRPTGSISLFGKHHGAGNSIAESANASTSQTPVTPTSGPASTFQGVGRSASHQMQSKGKDLLHTAGVLSGKGMTGAKGLFAKGKSRFKSDKALTSDSEPSSSRDASEEPSDIGSTASDTLARISLDTTDSLVLKEEKKEEKKPRRRFSSPFRRSRSSRPGSIVLPSREGTPRSTPSGSRPVSAYHALPEAGGYHPPEAWSAGPGPSALSRTSPITELQLGVLPSPAKSAFSFLGMEKDGEVPPIPSIPASVDIGGQVNAKLLESVVRNSSPLVGETAAVTEPPASRLVVDPDADAGHQEVRPGDSGVRDEDVEQTTKTQVAMEVLHDDEHSDDDLPSRMQDSLLPSTDAGRHEVVNEDSLVQDKDVPVPTRESTGEMQITTQRLLEEKSEDDSSLELHPDPVPPKNSPSDPDSNIVGAVAQLSSDDESEDDLPPQLELDTIPPEPDFVMIERTVEGAATIEPSHSEEVSPVLSYFKPHRLQDAHEEDEQQLRPHHLASNESQRPVIGISPMIAPTQPALDLSDSSEDEQPTPIARLTSGNGEVRFSYETELIGGDLSPISSNESGDEEKTPTKADSHTLPEVDASANQIAVTVVGATPSREADDALKATPRPKPQQQLSAYRVVHAVEYLHSQSSFGSESWEQESVVAPSQADDSPTLGQHDEAELPPLPVSPDLKKLDEVHVEEAGKASLEEGKLALMSVSNSPPVVPIKSDTPQEGQQQSPEFPKVGVHKRSESLISRISSMVSVDDASVSPVSSYGPRSRPPSALSAAKRQIPPAKASPIPVQIKEEPYAPDHTINSTIDDNDFDLYADHNGVVKDVRDEEGRPLRVATEGASRPGASSRTPISSSTKPNPLPTTMEEAPGRISDERPMSFVWGPDEINRPGNSDPPPPLPNTRIQRTSIIPNGSNPTKKMQQPRKPSTGQLLERPSQGDMGSKNVSPLSSHRESNKSSRHSNVSPPPMINASPAPQGSPPRRLSDRPPLESPKSPNGQPEPPRSPRSPDPRLVQDPRVMMEAQMRGWVPGQPLPQDPRLRGQLPGQGPRMPGHAQGPPSAPRNQYELQQMMARQAMQTPELKPSPAILQSTKKDDKSSRHKFSSVFKGLGKSNSNVPQAPQATQAPLQIQQHQGQASQPGNFVPDNAGRSASLLSGVSDLTPSQMAPIRERRSSAIASSTNRPTSLGQESHISQESTRVQVTDSRLDLRYPASPPPSQGIPPQHPPPHAMRTAPNLPRTQDHQPSTPQAPETIGKKKRFSSLGNIFKHNSATGTASHIKAKMSKEEKKAQKTQKNSGATSPQPVPAPQGQPWPPQQPVSPQQYGGIQYGSPPMARPFPGMQGMPLQPMQLQAMQRQQAMSPVSPQSMHQQSMSPVSPHNMTPYGMTQQYMQPHQGFQRQPQMAVSQIPPQFQRPVGVPEGSAYMDTMHVAQMMQAQRRQEQSRPPTHHVQEVSHSGTPNVPNFYQNVQRPNGPPPRPIDEHFRPDPHMIKPLSGIQQQPVQQAQYHPHHPQQQPPQPRASQPPPNPRSVSAPVAIPAANAVSHGSQRQASTPLEEPQYETPQIPAAYTHVSGAFVSPSFEQPISDFEDASPGPSHNRLYSDPHMQPISPQVSAMTASPPTARHNSNDSVVSPISNPSPGPLTGPSPPPVSKPQKQRMSSISEHVQSERPWHLDLPQGATEQEIVRARQRQYMEQQLAAQEQLHAERTGRSPSPRSGQSNQSTNTPPPPRRESGGFRELLPRSSPQPYTMANGHGAQRSQAQEQHLPSPPIAPAPVHPGLSPNPAAYPLPISPDMRSPVNPMANVMPPPPLPAKIPHTPMHASFPDTQLARPTSVDEEASNHSHDSLYDPPPPPPSEPFQHAPLPPQDYDDPPPTDEPPPYSGPGIPNEGMDKVGVGTDSPGRPRPPAIVTNAPMPDSGLERGRHPSETRQRQASLGILQHPQPASMAASPQRSSADMGANILQQQLRAAEERERLERLRQAEVRRVESARERQERERARARARELERSVSGGGRVGSLRSANGGGSARSSGYGGSGSARPVYELPAEEDEEPVMRATSFPGQEWVPTWTED